MAKELKIAGAPISWGVCEVPGWGHQMTPERVLQEMADLGLGATEFGPVGFLPTTPAEKAELLKKYNMVAVGGFFLVVLHDPEHDPLPGVVTELEGYAAAGAKTLVLAASTGIADYDKKRPELDDAGWDLVFKNLNRIREYAASVGVTAVVHPHVGTMVETQDDVMRLVNGSDIDFCLDTGHMLIGGTDPVEFVKKYAHRVKHTHMKDVNLEVALKVRNGELTYYQGVTQNLYAPLGKGDIDMKAIVQTLLDAGYDGWFVLEQDLVVNEEPAVGGWPYTDAAESVAFLKSLAG